MDSATQTHYEIVSMDRRYLYWFLNAFFKLLYNIGVIISNVKL